MHMDLLIVKSAVGCWEIFMFGLLSLNYHLPFTLDAFMLSLKLSSGCLQRKAEQNILLQLQRLIILMEDVCELAVPRSW